MEKTNTVSYIRREVGKLRPCLRLTGKILESAGFITGTRLEATVVGETIILTKIKQ